MAENDQFSMTFYNFVVLTRVGISVKVHIREYICSDILAEWKKFYRQHRYKDYMKMAIVTTTIHIPVVLEDFSIIAQENSIKDLQFVVAGDAKTPAECKTFCDGIEDKYGYETIYIGLEDQYSEYSKLANYIPKNSISRRNFAILKAYEMGADIIIMVDDDNFPVLRENYFRGHSIVGSAQYLNHIESKSMWFNVCNTLLEKHGAKFFHRGFPVNFRYEAETKIVRKKAKIALNEGLWMDAPDTDAITWLNWPDLQVISYLGGLYGETFAIADNTWSPLNSQNTAIMREAIPSYFLNPFNLRYDDIWAGYIFEKVAKHLGYSISFGLPLVEQRRNPHDYLVDLRNEIDGMTRTPSLIKELFQIDLESKSFYDSTEELINHLSPKFQDIKEGYQLWLQHF